MIQPFSQKNTIFSFYSLLFSSKYLAFGVFADLLWKKKYYSTYNSVWSK